MRGSKNMNTIMNNAKNNEKDEFYTLYDDVEKEVTNYTDQLKGKVIYCNADSEESNFYKYFTDNFDRLELKGLLICDKDFRGQESIDLLKQADVVITNPPFSLFREYVAQLHEYDKDYLIMGNNNAVTYVDYFPHIHRGDVGVGYVTNETLEFGIPDHYDKWSRVDGEGRKYGRVPAISWFTTLTVSDRPELDLSERYCESKYPKYDNYEAIEVSRVKNIPSDYYGVMGVPITYLKYHDPTKFTLVGSNRGRNQDPNKVYGRSSYLDGKETFKRLFIQRKQERLNGQ